MNCVPGDLAIVVASKERSHIGALVNVIRPCKQFHGAWEIKPLNHFPLDPGMAGWSCYDYNLRPIRDPGDDATDETLLWLPVPSKEHA